LEASKLLLVKLTQLTVGNQGLDKVPRLLAELFEGFGLGKDSSTSRTTSTTTTTTTTTLRTRNFKHQKYAQFYKERPEESHESVEEPEIRRMDLLSSLRDQIITTALQDRKIVAKANNVAVYSPARKVSKRPVKLFYANVQEEDDTAASQLTQQSLAAELNNTLKSHLLSLKTKVQTEKERKKEYKKSVVTSVQEQLAKFAEMLSKDDQQDDEQLVEEGEGDLATALEDQLRSFYGGL